MKRKFDISDFVNTPTIQSTLVSLTDRVKKGLFSGLYGVFWDSLPDGWSVSNENRISLISQNISYILDMQYDQVHQIDYQSLFLLNLGIFRFYVALEKQ